MTTSARAGVRVLAAGLAFSVLGILAAGCVGSDNGGVIQAPTTTAGPTVPGATTAATAPGITPTTPLGTLPGG
jgi:hypothetical protein